MSNYDLIIIGSGPGGYVAALYASRRGLRVCVVEKDALGGTCLNRGCIPTKTMLRSAVLACDIKGSSQFGIDVNSYKIDFPKIVSRKDEVVARLRGGIEALFRANKITLVKAAARLVGPNTVRADGTGELKAKAILVATGSRAAPLPGVDIDEKDMLSSDGILNIKELPKSLIVIGGGIIGCEFASLFNSLGVRVAIIELLDRLIPTQSKEAARKLETIFKKNGISVMTSTKVEGVSKGAAVRVSLAAGKAAEAEKVLVSVGRIPNTEGLGTEEAGIKTEKGRIVIDEYCRTAVKSIYAIGDCVGGPLLAHKASYEGILACDNILGAERRIDYSNIPACVYTKPEIASVGMTEEEAKEKGMDFKTARFPYAASGKAHATGKAEGFIKIVASPDGRILGVEIMGEAACELIGEAVLAKNSGLKVKDLAEAVHPHPSISEIFQEAAHIFCGTAIHGI
jgi:dihydrolipoamide dehydrogenase